MSIKVLEEPTYINHLEIDLSEHVLIYGNGSKWIVVPLKTMLIYPIIHDKYHDKVAKDGSFKMIDMTVTYCPFSGTGIVYLGKLYPTNELHYNNIVLQNGQNKFPQLIGLSKSKPQIEINIKHEVKIMTFRNAISRYPDCQYISRMEGKTVIPFTYYKNNKILHSLQNIKLDKRYHPKTFVYGIEYRSSDVNRKSYKYSVIVGKDALKSKVSSYDMRVNGFNAYLEQMIDKIREKGGIIIPCLWFAWMDAHPKSKVVKL